MPISPILQTPPLSPISGGDAAAGASVSTNIPTRPGGVRHQTLGNANIEQLSEGDLSLFDAAESWANDPASTAFSSLPHAQVVTSSPAVERWEKAVSDSKTETVPLSSMTTILKELFTEAKHRGYKKLLLFSDMGKVLLTKEGSSIQMRRSHSVDREKAFREQYSHINNELTLSILSHLYSEETIGQFGTHEHDTDNESTASELSVLSPSLSASETASANPLAGCYVCPIGSGQKRDHRTPPTFVQPLIQKPEVTAASNASVGSVPDGAAPPVAAKPNPIENGNESGEVSPAAKAPAPGNNNLAPSPDILAVPQNPRQAANDNLHTAPQMQRVISAIKSRPPASHSPVIVSKTLSLPFKNAGAAVDAISDRMTIIEKDKQKIGKESMYLQEAKRIVSDRLEQNPSSLLKGEYQYMLDYIQPLLDKNAKALENHEGYEAKKNALTNSLSEETAALANINKDLADIDKDKNPGVAEEIANLVAKIEITKKNIDERSREMMDRMESSRLPKIFKTVIDDFLSTHDLPPIRIGDNEEDRTRPFRMRTVSVSSVSSAGSPNAGNAYLDFEMIISPTGEIVDTTMREGNADSDEGSPVGKGKFVNGKRVFFESLSSSTNL